MAMTLLNRFIAILLFNHMFILSGAITHNLKLWSNKLGVRHLHAVQGKDAFQEGKHNIEITR